MKNLKVFVLAIIMTFGISLQNSFAQAGSETAEKVVVLMAVTFISAVADECATNRPNGGYMVCKGGSCESGKCISLRSSCNSGDGCA